MTHHKKWRYKNLTILVISILFAFFLSRSQLFHAFLLNLNGFQYVGAFVAGMLFISTFTVSTGAVMLFILAETLPAWQIGLVAGYGAVVGDLTILHLVKDNLFTELRPLYDHFGGNHLTILLHSRYFSWSLPVVGAIIIVSPLPDELGVALMGVTHMKTYQFITLSFILNSIGIYLTVSASQIFAFS